MISLKNLQSTEYEIQTNRAVEIKSIIPGVPGAMSLNLDETLVIPGQRDVEIELHADKIIVKIL